MPYTICNTRVCEPSHMIMGAEVSVWQIISFDGGWTSGSTMRACGHARRRVNSQQSFQD
jgi:hypothetical protein